MKLIEKGDHFQFVDELPAWNKDSKLMCRTILSYLGGGGTPFCTLKHKPVNE
jgi:hypothetical protein